MSDGGDIQQVVDFPITGISSAWKSSLSLRLDNGSVAFNKGVVAKVSRPHHSSGEITKENVGEDDLVLVEEFKVDSESDGVTAERTDAGNIRATLQSDEDSPTSSSSCVDPCAFALNAACPGMCGLTGAAFCAIISFKTGGLASFGCGSFFVLYCLLVDYTNPCYYKGSPEEDCEEIVCPKI